MGTADTSWQTDTAGAIGWHGLAKAGRTAHFVLRLTPALQSADMENGSNNEDSGGS